MDALKFCLRGKYAFFKVPDVNTFLYFTYGNIHKPALLGMFGAILGYGGYQRQWERNHGGREKGRGQVVFPEYYEKLKDLSISIVPSNPKGYWTKKVQTYNNSVGYASQEKGGNLVVKEQWLEDPEWTIYVKLDSEESCRLAEFICGKKSIYMPYLGKNDHFADIYDPKCVSVEPQEDEGVAINSLTPASAVEFDWMECSYKYEEYLPIRLDARWNQYEKETFLLTDALAESLNSPAYQDGDHTIVFY